MNHEPLVSPAWLEARLGDRDLRVVDASWFMPDQGRDAEQEFLSARIPGAQRFDPDIIKETSSPLPHMLPDPERFAAEMTALGIGHGDRVVAYDGLGLFSAPRAWWMLRVFGHERVHVLDGGFPAWKAAGLPVESGPFTAPPPADPPFRSQYRAAWVADRQAVLHALEDAETLILDARSPGRFSGAEPEPRPGLRSGHIPGSRNLHYARLIEAGSGTLKPVEALRALFDESGLRQGNRVICSCGSGITACILALGLDRIGFGPVAVYDGSWSEWGRVGEPEGEGESGDGLETPVERGSRP